VTSQRLHVDVTRLFDRPYQPTGITRLVIELARASREVSERAQAWRYDRGLGSFRKVSWNDIEELTGRTMEHVGPAQLSACCRIAKTARSLIQRRSALRLLHRGLHRLAKAVLGTSGLPACGKSDLFLFADILDEDDKLEAYRSLVASSCARFIFYCHDVIPLKFESFVTDKLRREFRRMIEIFSADNVTTICNSATTREDLQAARAELGLPNGSTIIVRPGCDFETESDPGTQSSLGEVPAGAYILYVSTVEIRKNHRVLLEAYDILTQDSAFLPPRLVLVGQKGWLVDALLQQIEERRGPAAYVTLMTDVSDAQLSRLYQDAAFTVYPSFYEGWGIPVAESLYHHKFCLCSDRGALREAGGKFVEYLDPEDAQLWARRIKHYIERPDDRLEREKRIRDEFKPRRWSDFRNDVGDLLHLLLNENGTKEIACPERHPERDLA
jgi:glycosyltransferase involved in cell wall biosynthesis